MPTIVVGTIASVKTAAILLIDVAVAGTFTCVPTSLHIIIIRFGTILCLPIATVSLFVAGIFGAITSGCSC